MQETKLSSKVDIVVVELHNAEIFANNLQQFSIATLSTYVCFRAEAYKTDSSPHLMLLCINVPLERVVGISICNVPLIRLSAAHTDDISFVGTVVNQKDVGRLLVCRFAHNSKAYGSSCWYCPQTIESFAAFAVSNLSLRVKRTETTTIATTSEMKNIEK
uniref:Uncharacterized protein n=1 Tax=Glossina pallidipes TaxID=7398 RepID=A0A1B0AC86_GLOPL